MKVTKPTTRRADSPAWISAKELGDAAEIAVARAFVERGYEVNLAFGKRKHDLILVRRAEVKHDRRAVESGHLALEVEHNGEPSGVAVSDAHLWVHIAGASALVGPPEAFRELAGDSKWQRVRAGDASRSLIVLVPVSAALAHPSISTMRVDL